MSSVIKKKDMAKQSRKMKVANKRKCEDIASALVRTREPLDHGIPLHEIAGGKQQRQLPPRPCSSPSSSPPRALGDGDGVAPPPRVRLVREEADEHSAVARAVVLAGCGASPLSLASFSGTERIPPTASLLIRHSLFCYTD